MKSKRDWLCSPRDVKINKFSGVKLHGTGVTVANCWLYILRARMNNCCNLILHHHVGPPGTYAMSCCPEVLTRHFLYCMQSVARWCVLCCGMHTNLHNEVTTVQVSYIYIYMLVVSFCWILLSFILNIM